MNKIYYSLIFVWVVYLVIMFSLYFVQRNLLYSPSENNYYRDKLTVSVDKVKIKTKDNIELLGWYHKKILKIIKLFFFCMVMQEHWKIEFIK